MEEDLLTLLGKEVIAHKKEFCNREVLFNQTKLYIEKNFYLDEERFFSLENFYQLKKLAELLQADPRIEELEESKMYDTDDLADAWIIAKEVDGEYGFSAMMKTMVDFVGTCYEFNLAGFNENTD